MSPPPTTTSASRQVPTNSTECLTFGNRCAGTNAVASRDQDPLATSQSNVPEASEGSLEVLPDTRCSRTRSLGSATLSARATASGSCSASHARTGPVMPADHGFPRRPSTSSGSASQRDRIDLGTRVGPEHRWADSSPGLVDQDRAVHLPGDPDGADVVRLGHRHEQVVDRTEPYARVRLRRLGVRSVQRPRGLLLGEGRAVGADGDHLERAGADVDAEPGWGSHALKRCILRSTARSFTAGDAVSLKVARRRPVGTSPRSGSGGRSRIRGRPRSPS